MKKRAMKKYIPKNTPYCYGCKNRVFKKFIDVNTIASYDDKEKEISSKEERIPMCICRYCSCNNCDNERFWDGIKECGVSY